MSTRHDTDATLGWMREGTSHLLATVAGLADDDLRAPSRLPGWTRAHVVGHVARNAEALTRLAAWARTGVETPMYADAHQRAAEIERSATLPAPALRDDLATTARQLDDALSVLTAEQWQAGLRSALGRAIPAAEVPWMRVREVWLHAVDLDTGASVADLPTGVLDLLLDDVTAGLTGKDDCPPVVLDATDRDRVWMLGPDAGDAATAGASTVGDDAAGLVAWITGRADRLDRPRLPRWL